MELDNIRYHENSSVIRDTEVYRVIDNTYLMNLTVSQTILHPGQCTKGHSHDGLEEVYIFTSGHGKMEVGTQMLQVSEGDVVMIKGGEFHKVYNDNATDFKFLAIFQKYDRGE